MAQSGQYRATAESSLGCGGGSGRDVTTPQLCEMTIMPLLASDVDVFISLLFIFHIAFKLYTLSRVYVNLYQCRNTYFR